MIELIHELDFENRAARTIHADEVPAAMAAGKFVWLDLTCAHARQTEQYLAAMFPSIAHVVEELIDDEPDTGYTPFPDLLHIYLAACDLEAHGPEFTRVDFIMTERFAAVVTRRDTHFMHSLRRECLHDFKRFARSPSFLVYELFDHHVRAYEWVQNNFQRRGEELHKRLLSGINDRSFGEVARLGADLLLLRRHAGPCRAVLNEVSTRRSPFVSRATQEFLRSMVAEMDRLLNEINVDRDILNDAVAGAVSLITYRTNMFINRLTVVSFVFLPLTFLVGVYGMNFEHQPEYKWRFGYVFFWSLALAVAATAILIIQHGRRKAARALRAGRAGPANPSLVRKQGVGAA
ncbi:MAG: magnesium transporter CorA family protein [Phycisphaerales bacterium]